jgi:hypothetical protein
LCITIGCKTKKQAIKKCMFDDLAKSKTAANKRRYKSRMAYSDHKVPRFSTGGALVSGGENTKKRKATRHTGKKATRAVGYARLTIPILYLRVA